MFLEKHLQVADKKRHLINNIRALAYFTHGFNRGLCDYISNL